MCDTCDTSLIYDTLFVLSIRYVAGIQEVRSEHPENTVLENVNVTSLVKNHWEYRDKLHALLQVLHCVALLRFRGA